MTFDVIAAARRRTRRLTAIVAGGVVLLVAAVCLAGTFTTGRLEDTPPSAVPTGAASASASADAALPLALPADVTWQVVAGVALPFSPSAGPRRLDGGLASGFARTPAGALIAGVHLLVRTTPQVGPAVFEPTLDQQVVGEHADAMRAAVADDYRALGGDTTAGGPVGSLTSALAGVRMSSFTATAASIDLLTIAVDTTGTPRFAATLVQVAWTGADWALVAPPGGRWGSTVRPVTAAQAAAYPPLTPNAVTTNV